MEGFVKVAMRNEVSPSDLKLVEVVGEQIVLADIGGGVVAFTNVCPHAACELVYGELEDQELECACHGSRFNVTTGEVLQGPATEPLTLYAVRMDGDDVLVGPG